MLATLGLALLAARAGLRLRTTRRARLRRDPALRPRHVRLGKLAVGLLVPGFALGSASAVWLRGLEPFSTAHGAIATATLLLFGAVAALGLRLERRGARPALHDLHGGLGLAALLAAAAAFFTGFVLLP